MSGALISYQRSFFSQQKGTVAEKHTPSKHREQPTMGCPAPDDTSTTQTPHLREHHGRWGGKTGRVRGPGSLPWDAPSSYDREAIVMKSQQCGCLSKTWVRATPVVLSVCKKEVSSVLPIDKELQHRQWTTAREWEPAFLSGSKWLLKTDIWATPNGHSRLHLHICIASVLPRERYN